MQMDNSTDNIDISGSGTKMLATWSEIPNVITKCIQAAQYMHQTVYNINTEMENLAKVSNATSLQLNTALETATEAAKKYGLAISDVINATNKSLSSTLLENQSSSITDKMNSLDISSLIYKLVPDIKDVGRVELIACPQF